MVERIDLGTLYLGGINKPAVEDVGKIAVVALDSLSRPNLSYQTQTATVANDAFATTLAPHLRGVGLTVDTSGNLAPRLRMRKLQMRDQFISGGTASGSIGQLNWSLLGSGTPAVSRSSITTTLGNSEKLVLTTSGSANDRTVLCLGETETRAVIIAGEAKILQTLGRLPALTDRRFFFGMASNFATETSAGVNVLGIYYDSAVSPNWRIIARSSSSGSPVDTGVPAPNNTAELLTIYQPTAGTFQFYSGNTLIGSISSGVPTAPMNLGWRLETLAASAKTHHLGGFILDASTDAATNAADDDTFLEA
jgi:hypothetical protein